MKYLPEAEVEKYVEELFKKNVLDNPKLYNRMEGIADALDVGIEINVFHYDDDLEHEIEIYDFYDELENFNQVSRAFYWKAVGYSGALLTLAGLFFIRDKSQAFKLTLLSGTLLMLLVLFKSGDRFYDHPYYVAPFIPIMALLAGLALNSLPKRWALFAVLVLLSEGVFSRWSDQFIKKGKYRRVKLFVQ